MVNITTVFQKTGLTPILGKITNPLTNYCRLIWSNSQMSGVVIQLFTGTATYVYSFDAFASGLLAIFFGVALGAMVGLIISFFVILVEFIRFHFFYKKQLPHHTWDDYRVYRNNPELKVNTRGGDISITDMLNAEDVEIVYETIRPLKPIERIMNDCFKSPGWYLVNKKWKSLIELLKRYGVIKKITTMFGFKISEVAVETFLLSAYNQIESLPVAAIFSTRFFDTLVLSIHDYSRTKVMFNATTLLFITFGTACLTVGLTSSIVLNAWGFGGTVPGLFARWLVKNAASWILIPSSSLYYAGQFVPARNCDQFARRLAESKFEDISKENLMEAKDSALIHIPEAHSTSHLVQAPDINLGITTKTSSNMNLVGTENSIPSNGLKTLNDLESDKLSLVERYKKTLWNRQELWKRPINPTNFDDDDMPVQQSTYNRLREKVLNFLD